MIIFHPALMEQWRLLIRSIMFSRRSKIMQCNFKCEGTPAVYRVTYKDVPFFLCDTCFIDFKENGPGWQ